MIVRYQIGGEGGSRDLSWRALRAAIVLMQRMEPGAEIHVTHQAPVRLPVANVIYHEQDASFGMRGRHEPARFNINSHELYVDNDHIMWSLPACWEEWKRSSITLGWEIKWDYYGKYSDQVRTVRHLSAGMWGLPPGFEWSMAPEGDEADEMGWIVERIVQPEMMYVTWDEVRVYCPSHSVLGGLCGEFGTCGVHLMSLNRDWNPHAREAIERIEREHGIE